MHKSHIDLSDSIREKMISELNARLADTIHLSIQTKQAHWNVKGPNFIGIHELLDQVHGHMEASADLIAERVSILGGTAMGNLPTVMQQSNIAEYPTDIFSAADHVSATTERLGKGAEHMRASIKVAADAGDSATEDLFTEVTRVLDKQRWFIEAHQQA